MNGPLKAYSILAGIYFALIVGGYAGYGHHGLMWAFVLSLTLHWLFYSYFDPYVFGLFKARRLEGHDPWGVLESLKKLSRQARLPLPRVYLIDCPFLVNTFSIARQHEKSFIFIAEPLLTKLTREERHALLALEVARIQRLDTVAMTLASAFLETLLFLPRLFESRYRWKKRTPPWLVKRSWLNHGLLHLMAPLTWPFRRLLVGPGCYYAADELAVHYLQSPRMLAQALWKLESYARSHRLDVPASIAHLFAVNPLTADGWSRYFQAQPPVENRIRRLTGDFPL